MAKRYIVTDSCFFYEPKKKRGRSPHVIELVDVETGNVKKLKSGSVIKIVRERK